MILGSIIQRLKSDQFSDAWKQEQYQSLAQEVAHHLQGSQSIVDLGCGEGVFSQSLRKALPADVTFVGMDIAPETAWQDQPNVNYIVGDASRPPFSEGAVSAALAKDLLHHMDEPHLGVEWLLKMAVDKVVIIEASLDNPIMAFYTAYNGDQHMTTEQFKSLLKEVDSSVRWEYTTATRYPFYLPPVTSLHAIWVWPITALMLVAFKLFKSRSVARLLDKVMRRFSWPASYNIATAELSRDRLLLGQ